MSDVRKWNITSKEHLQEVVTIFAQQIHAGDILCMYGELGAGKTTFMQFFAQALGIEKRVISPTFIIMRTYDVSRDDIHTLYHADLYRLTDASQVEGTGLLEALEEKDAVVAIEWPDRMGNLLPDKRWDVTLAVTGDQTRALTIEKI